MSDSHHEAETFTHAGVEILWEGL